MYFQPWHLMEVSSLLKPGPTCGEEADRTSCIEGCGKKKKETLSMPEIKPDPSVVPSIV
jgi:hypothetical protein